jgi:hypothetical protein
MDLTVFIEPELNLERLAEVLDGMGHEGRVHCTRGWSKATQAKLYEAVKGHKPLSIADMVPAGTAPLTEVIHDLKNSLPLFSVAQKRFCRLDDNDKQLCGYNEGSTRGLVGPGFFTARDSETNPGEILIDYKTLPKAKAHGWPDIRSNDSGLSALVYGNMVDTMRRISEHVTIGRAAKNGADMDAWFVLVRKDPA